jgi:hypothetical protein
LTELSQTNTSEVFVRVLRKALKEAWKFITAEDRNSVFAEPVGSEAGSVICDYLFFFLFPIFFSCQVTDDIAVDYSSIVKHPMDLGTVLSKLNKEKYSTLESFNKDLNRIFDNCILYNTEDSDFGRVGQYNFTETFFE